MWKSNKLLMLLIISKNKCLNLILCHRVTFLDIILGDIMVGVKN